MRRQHTPIRTLVKLPAAALLAVALVGGCGSGGGIVVRPPVSHSAATTTGGVSSPPAATNSAPSNGAVHPVATVTPDHGLADRQRVQVTASGFSPGEALQVIECAAKGSATGAGDCNLAGITAVTSDGSGKVSLSFQVVRGPFGGNRVVCGPAQACLISVTQATLSPTEEADVPIAFA